MLDRREKHLLLCAVIGMSLSGALHAADAGRAAEARKTYEAERARCLGAPATEDRKACLREAGAALAEAKAGRLAAGSDFEENRLARCDVHKDQAEHDYCLRRMKGEGTISGSVEDGGILRELTVVVPADEAGRRSN
jgi:hypothetical protein